MNLLELFSGIGGFAKGFEQAGFKFDKHFFSEIDKHAIANYKHNFPNAESIGSVTDVRGNEIERPDIITFGFPCQDLSIAGKRKGFDGERSSLFYQAMRIINEVKPDIFIFENVKGLFSSNGGKDFTAVLRTIADIGLYECEWQMCNTKWLLPQNRERVYFIGHLTGRSQPRVFPFREDDFKITGNGINEVIQMNGSKESGGKQPYQQNRVYNGNGLNPALNQLSNRMIVHNTMPRSRNPKQGGTGHLTRNDGIAYNIDTGNTNAVELKPLFNTENNSQGEKVYDVNGLYSSANKIYYKSNIRRLTEIECERLQGFPDNWTQYGNYDGVIKKIAKSQRYKLLGNAVTVNIVQLIAERLK